MPAPGSVHRAYLFTCALCGQSEEFWLPMRNITKTQAERQARKTGWTQHGRMGWSHKGCVQHAEDTVLTFSGY
jgi:hypothetical protein